MTNPTFPWSLDKPLEELKEWLDDEPMFKTTYGNHPSYTIVQYLLTRLKLVEGERDEAINAIGQLQEMADRHDCGECGGFLSSELDFVPLTDKFLLNR